MTSIDLFLKSLSSLLNEKNKNVDFIPRWTSIKDEKFPAYTKFTLEINELINFKVTYKFRVQSVENTSNCIDTENYIDCIKEKMTVSMIKLMLRYYMYGESVQ
jgi:hypothetical protein